MADEKQVEPVTEIEARGLSVAYDQFVALECSELSIKGNLIAVVGHNGAGKSTLIKCILGLLPPKAGTLTAQYRKHSKTFKLLPEKHMAFCPETGSVFGDITVENYVRLWCRIKHHDANYYKKAGSRYVEMLSLSPLMSKLGRELSKGQCRRVQTAIGFLTEPKLFLFDEPFDGLDVQKTNELIEILTTEAKQMTFIVSSHRMDVVERLADALIVLKEGQVLTSGTLDQVVVDLCRRSVVISNPADGEALLGILRQDFPTCLVNRIGSRISITGSDLDIERLAAFVKEHDKNGARVQEVRPSLVEAMNYHLRSLG